MSNALLLQTIITMPIGHAVRSPLIPTSGDTRPPPKNGSNPRNADALPAASPCASMPSEKAVVDTIPDRKSTRLNSSHVSISYAVFCLKKKNSQQDNSVISQNDLTVLVRVHT